jgi:hypothetical protein
VICSNETLYLSVKLLAVIGAFSLIAACGVFMFCLFSRRLKNEISNSHISS